MMKKLAVVILSAVLCLGVCISAFAADVSQDGSFTVTVFNTEGEGLALKTEPDINSVRMGIIPEDQQLVIYETSGGWGYTYYSGMNGWVALQYTKIQGSYRSVTPDRWFGTAADCKVDGTGNEGLELRTAPTIDSSTFGPVPEGAAVQVQAIQGKWAYTSYKGNSGWLNTTYLKNLTFYASVFNTENEGLTLKSSADINSSRIGNVPEGTALKIDRISGDWGHTSYNGQSGWVALRYTKVDSSYIAKSPDGGYIDAANYTVVNTGSEGLEFRTAPTVNSPTYGPLPNGSLAEVLAINGSWAYAYYNGQYGWLYTDYLYNGSFQAKVYDTENEGLALKRAADINSERLLTIPEGKEIRIDSISGNWGHTSYNGYTGWVYLKYIKVTTDYTAEKPAYGWIETTKYYVTGTGNEGLQLRTGPTAETSTFGAIPDKAEISVEAIQGSWAYASYKGVHGWVYTQYITR